MTLRSKLPLILFLSLTLPCLCFAADDKEAMFKTLEGEIDAIRARMISGTKLRRPPLPVEGENSFANLKADHEALRAYAYSRPGDTDAGQPGVKRAGPVTGLEKLSGDEFKRIQADLKRIAAHVRSIDPISADFPKRDMPTPDGLVATLKEGYNDIVKYALGTKQDLKPYEAALEKMLKDVADGGPDNGADSALELVAGMGAAGGERFAPLAGKIITNPKYRESHILNSAAKALAGLGDAGLGEARQIMQKHRKELNHAALAIARAFKRKAQPLAELFGQMLANSAGDKETFAFALESLREIGPGIDAAAPAIIKFATQPDIEPEFLSLSAGLISLGCHDPVQHVEFLFRVLRDDRIEGDNSMMAGYGLMAMGKGSNEFADALIKRAQFNAAEDLHSCVELFEFVPTTEALEFLEKVAGAHGDIEFPKNRHAHWETRTHALLAMINAGAKFERIRGFIASFLISKSWALRAGGVRALVRSKQDDDDLLKMLGPLLQKYDGEPVDQQSDRSEREGRPLFPLWASVALANGSKDAKDAMAAWKRYKDGSGQARYQGVVVDALACLRCSDAAVIEAVEQHAQKSRDRRESARLNAVLAVWNADLPKRFEKIKSDLSRNYGADVLFILTHLEKEKAAPLFDEVRRCSLEHSNWDARVLAKLLLQRWR